MKTLLFKTLILTLVSTLILVYVFDPIFKDVNANSKTFNEFYKGNFEDSLDILIIGSSHAKNAYYPKVIDSVFNTKSYNLSTGGQNYLTTNLLLDDVLKKSKPKLVIVDLFPALMRIPDAEKSKGSQLRVIDYTDLSFRKVNIINKIYNLSEQPSVYSETIRNHDKWFDRNWQLKEFVIDNKNFLFYNGYFNSVKIIGEKEKEKYKAFVVEQEKYLKIFPSEKERSNFEKDYSDIIETIKICKKYNTKVLFVSAPYFDSFYRDDLNKKHFLLNNYFNELSDIDYIDFNLDFNKLGLNFDDYWDKGHLNINGSYKTSISLTNEIAKRGYFKVIDSAYFNKQLAKIKPRKIENIQEILEKSMEELFLKITYNGKLYNVDHDFDNNIGLKKITFNIDSNNRYIVMETKEEIKNFKNYYFLISNTIYQADFDKRPKWQLSTDKNKLHWEVFPENVKLNDKNYILLTFDKKCDIEQFKRVRIVLKRKEDKTSTGKALILNDVKLKNTSIFSMVIA
jgi:hypothetical protein